jgi:hypothetical protein
MFDQLTVTVTGADNTGAYPMVRVQYTAGGWDHAEWVAASALYGIRTIGQPPTTDNYRLVSVSVDLEVATLRYNAGQMQHSEYTRNLTVNGIPRIRGTR